MMIRSKSLCDRTNYPFEDLASKCDKQNKLESLNTGLPSSVCVVDCAIDGFISDQISLSKGDALGF